jgi:hypothetical protein
MAHTVRGRPSIARQRGNDEETTMIAEPCNGVNHAGVNRRLAPSNDASDNACQYGTQPSPNGDNGACHDGAPPSTNGDNGASQQAEAPSPNGDNGRDASGRFATGNAGGPGNPFGRLVARLRSVFCRRITEQDIEAIADKLIEKARAGDVSAARLLLSYGIGKPTEAVNPDTLDLAEWDIFRKSPVSLDDLHGIVDGIPVDVAGPLVRNAKPFLNAKVADLVMGELLRAPKPSRKERRAARRRQQQAGPATAG